MLRRFGKAQHTNRLLEHVVEEHAVGENAGLAVLADLALIAADQAIRQVPFRFVTCARFICDRNCMLGHERAGVLGDQ